MPDLRSAFEEWWFNPDRKAGGVPYDAWIVWQAAHARGVTEGREQGAKIGAEYVDAKWRDGANTLGWHPIRLPLIRAAVQAAIRTEGSAT